MAQLGIFRRDFFCVKLKDIAHVFVMGSCVEFGVLSARCWGNYMGMGRLLIVGKFMHVFVALSSWEDITKDIK